MSGKIHKIKALVVEDDPSSAAALAKILEQQGFEASHAATLKEARTGIGSGAFELVLCDLFLPDGRGSELLQELEGESGPEVVLITGQATVEAAVEALRLGAFDFLTKPVDVARLKSLIASVRRTRRLKSEVSELTGELRGLGRFGPMVGRSRPMQRVYDLIERVAPTEATVLLVGPSGTGKELAAEALHQRSTRRDGPLVPVNCGAMSVTLIESELFGHEKGAFTGADRRHVGCFERAGGGTLFLDEITEMPVELQVKLLRVLETRKIQRVGGRDLIDVDVRVLAATNRDPEQAVADGKLREDLYYRLKVFPIALPSLAQRREDVPLLAEHFLEELNAERSEQKRFSAKALTALSEYQWPGNVRELKNLVERAFILADDAIELSHLPLPSGTALSATTTGGPGITVGVGSSLREAEKKLILATLDHLEGDKKQAAEILGVSLKTLYNRLKVYEAEK